PMKSIARSGSRIASSADSPPLPDNSVALRLPGLDLVLCIRARLQPCRNASYQGTASAVPQSVYKIWGFSPWASSGRTFATRSATESRALFAEMKMHVLLGGNGDAITAGRQETPVSECWQHSAANLRPQAVQHGLAND